MKILLIHPQPEVREMLVFPLEGKIPVTVMGAADEKECLEILDGKKFSAECIIADSSPATLEILGKLQKERALNALLVLCNSTGATKPPAIPGLKFKGFAAPDNLLQNLVTLLEPEVKQTGDAKDEEFCRINTALLLKFNPLAADVFIRLSPTHHVKLFNKNDSFDIEDLKKFRDVKKVDYLYLRKEDGGIFMDRLISELKKMLTANPPPGPVAATETVENAVETIHDMINQFGVTEEVQEAVKGTVDVAMKTMGEFPALGDIMKNIKDHQGKYIGHHSMLLASLACALAVELDWYSDATFEKLTMAAFMHDSALTDHDLCKVQNLLDFDKKHKGKFSLAQVQEYKAHPEKSALLLGHFKELPAEVDKIVLQHHEHPTGTGFPAQLSGNYIQPLSALFIVAHDLADFLIEKNGDFDVDEFLTLHKNKYASGNFKKIAKAIDAMYA